MERADDEEGGEGEGAAAPGEGGRKQARAAGISDAYGGGGVSESKGGDEEDAATTRLALRRAQVRGGGRSASLHAMHTPLAPAPLQGGFAATAIAPSLAASLYPHPAKVRCGA